MKHSVILSLATLFLFAGCAKDAIQNEETQKDRATDSRTPNLVTICHRLGNGNYNAIQVNANAVAAHLAHGDYLPDADGDGYSAIGACTGSMDDCDDTNADVHPGATEICDNGIDDDCDGVVDCGDCTYPFFTEASVNNNAPFFAYYDSDVSVCDILGVPLEGVWIFYEDNIFPAVLAIEIEEGFKVVASLTETGECVAFVGETITEEQYEAAQATLRAVIAANPTTPNICDLFGGLQNPDRPATEMAGRKGEILAKLKQTLPAKLRERLNK